MPLPAELGALLGSAAYPHPTADIRLVETHISWVLLTGEFAYKLKRPVRLGFVDFGTLALREHFCREELRLNRRFAPGLYLDVVPIYRATPGVRVGEGSGAPLEYALRMRQFPRSAELRARLAAGLVQAADFAAFGARLAAIHAASPACTRAATARDPAAAVRENADACLAAVADPAAHRRLEGVRARLLAAVDAQASRLAQRERDGRVRDVHGDLHIDNLVWLDESLVAFDCLEFDARLRIIDVAQEIAFLSMDLREEGYGAAATAFLNGYCTASGDFAACAPRPLFEAHYALVRAKVEGLLAAESAQREAALARQARYLNYAEQCLRPAEARCILIGGVSGSGKSWLATRLAARLGGIHLRSDFERKRLAGLPLTAHAPAAYGAGLYDAEADRRVYERLAGAARAVLDGGLDVVVDATFLTARQRAEFLNALGAQSAAPLRTDGVRMLWCEAPPAELRRRIAARAQAGGDPSDADATVLAAQLAAVEPPAASGQPPVLELDTAGAESLERAGAWAAAGRV